MAEVRQFPPRKGHPQLKWEVLQDNTVIGWVEGKQLRGSRHLYYQATGVHPNGKSYNLEGSYDFEQQVAKLVRFKADPSEFNQHLPHTARIGL